MAKNQTFEEALIERDEGMVAPNIFIGLGGQGCDMVADLATVAKANGYGDDRLAFIALDTDVNELRKIKMKASNVITIQTSSRMTIGEYLRYDDNARENWFPINDIILDKTPSEGAGQVRAISNLVAHNAIREGEFYKIDDAIDRLFLLSEDNYQQSVHVTIVGTLAGGTGSGLVLPVSLYVRNYLEKVRQQKSSVFRGFFILPDVMESVIKHTEERDNLYSNAYASLREIDAFMRRAYDVKLQERYPNLKVVIPKAGGDGYDEFNQRPFDFCFLFNKVNLKDTNIKNKEDLLKQAVECIYDMSISPISAKVNSQEDNIIREKIKTNNRQSYAGAGAAKLIYPYDDILTYVALDWVNESISTEWLGVDREVEKQRRSSKESGTLDKFDEKQEYVRAIEGQEDKIFEGAILEQCKIRESAIKTVDKADQYVKEVESYITRILKDSESNRSGHRRKCKDNAADVLQERQVDKSEHAEEQQAIHDEATELIDEFTLCVADVKAEANAKAKYIATNLININPDDVKGGNKNKIPVIELAMSGEDFFMHPNAARYFLNKVSLELESRIIKYERAYKNEDEELEEAQNYIESLRVQSTEIDKRLFKPKYVVAEGRDKEIATTVSAWVSGFSVDEDGEGESGDAKLDDYCKHLACVIIYERVKNYINGLIEGYQEIFKKIGGELSKLDEKKEDIENKYQTISGKAVRYVCADKDSLEKFTTICKNNITLGDLPEEFTRQFYDKAKFYADKKASGALVEEYGIFPGCSDAVRNNALNALFGNVFDDIILKSWKSFVKREYVEKVNKIDLNVLQAAYREAVYKGISGMKDQNSYVKDLIERTSNLAAEFIDKPKGAQPRQLRSSLYHTSLKDVGEEQFENFREALDGFQGVASSKVSKYELRFFSAIYKLSAKNLAKMRPPVMSVATNDKSKMENAGKYFEVYHRRMKDIHPLDSVNTEITPHIQRNWQFINALPELDEEYQKECEVRIAKAFVYALISGKIDYRKQDSSGFNYSYELIDAKLNSPQLVVSNGTYCDQIYETLDALSISPAYVERLLELFEEEVNEETIYKIDFDKSKFVRNSKQFILEEYSRDKQMTIFDIPLVYKESAGAEYSSDWGEAIINAIIEMVDYVSEKLSNKKDVDKNRLAFLYELFELFDASLPTLDQLGTLETDSDENGLTTRSHSRLQNISGDSITLRIYDVIANVLEENDSKHAYSQEHEKMISNITEKRRKLAR